MKFRFGSACLCSLFLVAQALAQESPYVSTEDALLARADQLEHGNRFEQAIPIYENLIKDGEGRDVRWTAYVLYRLAAAEYQAGDSQGALESAGGAVNLDPEEPSYKAFQADLAAQKSGVHRSAVYRPRRDEGSAKRLVSTNGVLHIFVYGRNAEPWDPEEQDKAQAHIEESDRWLAARAAESGARDTPTFMHRFISVADEPFWRRLDVPEEDSSRAYRKAWMDAVLVRFQAASYAELFDRVFEGADFKNRSILFHSSKREMSFALAPYRPGPGDMESAFVQSAKTEWVSLYEPVFYTHEFLHLYGADDLYNKVTDPDVPSCEIMNFGAHSLEGCTVSALTRYAIGWTDQPPHLKCLHLAAAGGNPKPKKGKHT